MANTSWFQENVVKTNTVGIFGMYGTDLVYYFYMKFSPAQDILLSGTSFYLWFQMGDTESDWEGI